MVEQWSDAWDKRKRKDGSTESSTKLVQLRPKKGRRKELTGIKHPSLRYQMIAPQRRDHMWNKRRVPFSILSEPSTRKITRRESSPCSSRGAVAAEEGPVQSSQGVKPL
ncbi:hypothetical protein TNIN_140441 [Trichonephila inaurata madagascariensis]|uniref:Uncharacterized protein n=1 Tax=Trichonephila inaurata madagascariensis TaxID=2747483 RepID=A0A8X6IF02_9ARAC|nr:hypothetical protein TNIN_140441 [Trichonephila inaurata madagascariensis]